MFLLNMAEWLREGPDEFTRKPQFERGCRYVVVPLMKRMGHILPKSRPHLREGLVSQSIDDPPLAVVSKTFINEAWQRRGETTIA